MSNLPNTMKAVAYTGQRKVALIHWPFDASPLAADGVAGRTLVSLVSPGTEVNGGFDKPREQPAVGGYASVFEVTAVGNAVKDIAPGQHVFAMGSHAAWQRTTRAEVVPLPIGLNPEIAVFCRMMGVSWTTLTTTTARPGDRVLVAGLGLVGHLAALIFQSAGYVVTGIDPLESRRALANRARLDDTRASAAGQEDLVGAITLALECAGHEQATLDCCRVVRKGGEVVLVGVPWKKRCDVTGFEILKEVFHRYLILRSGWEWQLPRQSADFAAGGIYANFATALNWLATGRVHVDGLYQTASPADAQAAYDSLFRQEGNFLSVVFDWTGLA